MAKSLSDKASELPDAKHAKAIEALQKRLEKAEAAAANAERLREIIDHQSTLLEQRASQLFKSPKARPNVKGGHFHRVLVPDTHGAHIDPKAAAAFLGDLEYLRPREVVWLGDHLDCGGFLAEHHTLGFVAETAFSFTDDIREGNAFLDRVQDRCQQSVHHFLTGNHEHRIQKWCCTHTLRHPKDAGLLLEKLGVQTSLNLAARGIHYYPRDYIQPGLRTRGCIKLGPCYFVHDVSIAANCTDVALNKYAASVMFGDTHRIKVSVARKAEQDLIAATNGCLSVHQPLWQETNVTEWSHGYGVQIVTNDGRFLHIVVPIIEGRSLLGPLLGAVK